MSKKLKIILAVSLAALVLVVGAGITVMAAETPTPTPPIALARQDTLLDRVAQILGVSRESLVNAMTQARQELWQKPGGTTPTPVTPDDFYNRVAQILGTTKEKLVDAMQQAAKEIQTENLNNQLNQAVQNGKLTQDEANQIKDWIGKKPSALDKLFGFRGFGGFGGYGGMMGRGGCFRFGGGPGFRGGWGLKGIPAPSQTPAK